MEDMTREESRREMAIDRGEFDPSVSCQKCGDEGYEYFPATRYEPAFTELCECPAGERRNRLDDGEILCGNCGDFENDHTLPMEQGCTEEIGKEKAKR